MDPLRAKFFLKEGRIASQSSLKLISSRAGVCSFLSLGTSCAECSDDTDDSLSPKASFRWPNEQMECQFKVVVKRAKAITVTIGKGIGFSP